jgi:hypothetical protein
MAIYIDRYVNDGNIVTSDRNPKLYTWQHKEGHVTVISPQ